MDESLGTVALSIEAKGKETQSKSNTMQRRKWVRKKNTSKGAGSQGLVRSLEHSKRQLVDVMITEGPVEACGSGEKKRRHESKAEEVRQNLPEMVLEG